MGCIVLGHHQQPSVLPGFQLATTNGRSPMPTSTFPACPHFDCLDQTTDSSCKRLALRVANGGPALNRGLAPLQRAPGDLPLQCSEEPLVQGPAFTSLGCGRSALLIPNYPTALVSSLKYFLSEGSASAYKIINLPLAETASECSLWCSFHCPGFSRTSVNMPRLSGLQIMIPESYIRLGVEHK